jgi:putative hydrolase of the HAD superfamily
MRSRLQKPQVIFLDAVGTLFGVRGSVGEQYANITRQFGVTISAEILNRAFFQSFQEANPPAFPGCDPTELTTQEFNWWFEIAIATFKRADAFHLFPDFEAFFTELFAYFATAEPWIVYPEVPQMLQRWQEQGIPLGIISNFDSRIYPVLQALGLLDYFSSITISTEAGAAKPHSQIFATALHKHQCLPSQAIHIGDSLEEDYRAAQMAGLRGIWLRRQ